MANKGEVKYLTDAYFHATAKAAANAPFGSERVYEVEILEVYKPTQVLEVYKAKKKKAK